ncbi:MAG: hypothetical protein V2I33_20190 [Kangiellaceae bacterium]|jgi:hypothetical protein|nr:hypothetical protein [Kangiellaceae bacterium]
MEDSQDKRKLVLPVINLNKLAPGFKLSQTTSFHSNPPVPNAPGSGTISVGSSLNVGYGKALEST